jgi:hypothetical protein
VPPVRNLRPGYKVVHPNRDKAGVKLTRLLIVVVLAISIALILIVTIGGWSKLQGLKPINFFWCLIYVAAAVFIWRWARGLLPITAAFAMLLLIIALIAGVGLSGTSWFDRGHFGFAGAQTLFGGKGLSADTLGFVTVLMAPVQLLLIILTMAGFAQGWNVESEVPEDESKRGSEAGGKAKGKQSSEPATA